jgi:hypothetical protein
MRCIRSILESNGDRRNRHADLTRSVATPVASTAALTLEPPGSVGAPALLGFGALVAHGRGNVPLMLSTLAAVALTVISRGTSSDGAAALRSPC